MISSLLGLVGSSVWGDSVLDAQNKMSAAYEQFYKQVRAQPNASSEDLSNAYQKTVVPANSDLNHSIQDARLEAYKSSGVKSVSESDLQGKQLIMTDTMIKSLGNQFKSFESSINFSGNNGPTSVADTEPAHKAYVIDSSKPTRAPVVIDGSNVPKEVSFPGRKPATTSK